MTDNGTDPVLDALAGIQETLEARTADLKAELEAQREDLRQLQHELKRLRDRLGIPDDALAEPTNQLDALLMRTVAQLWRDQGQKPATTRAVAMRIGYSPDWTLELLKDAAREKALIYEIPGTGERCSGKWTPLNAYNPRSP